MFPQHYVKTTSQNQNSENVIENSRLGFPWALIRIYIYIYIYDVITYDNCTLLKRLNSYMCHLNQKPKITIEDSP